MDIIKGDLFQNTTGIIVHGCNVSGGYGSGIAGIIADKYPEAQHEYFLKMDGYSYKQPNRAALGTIQPVKIYDDFYIVNGFTQLRYGGPGVRWANPSAIRDVLDLTADFAIKMKMDVYAPKIGTGLGGITWEEVEKHFEAADTKLRTVGQKLTVYYL